MVDLLTWANGLSRSTAEVSFGFLMLGFVHFSMLYGSDHVSGLISFWRKTHGLGFNHVADLPDRFDDYGRIN